MLFFNFEPRIDLSLKEVIWPNKYLLTLVGLWPMPPDIGPLRRIFAYFRTIVGLSAIVCLLVPLIMTITFNWGNIKIFGEYGAVIIPYAMLMLKMLYLVIFRQSFDDMYQRINEFWNTSDDPKDRVDYMRLAIIAKITTIVSFLSGMADLFSFEAACFIQLAKNLQETNHSLRYRPLPLELYYGFDTQPTPTYELIFMWQNICMIFIICAIIGCDCTVMVFVVHVSARFRLLSLRFLTVAWKIKERSISEREIRDEFGKCIAQHQHIISVANEMNELLSPMVFSQVMSTGLEICLAGYAVMEGENTGAELAKFVALFCSVLIQLGVWCFPAEFLIQESTGIADTIFFEVPWYKLSSSQQRDLSFVIMRAQQDCHVSALYKVMCIMRLTEVFNAAGSYMALLRSMKK